MSLPINPAEKLHSAPFSDLMRVLLNQFRRLLDDKGVKLASDEILAISFALEDYATHEKLPLLRAATTELVQESLQLLVERWGLTFLESLGADMDTLGGWETTADFLEIVNEKSNAELRISAGSALLVAMGNSNYVPYLMDILKDDNGAMDVDAAFARRSLCHISHVAPDAPNWLAQVKHWIHEHEG